MNFSLLARLSVSKVSRHTSASPQRAITKRLTRPFLGATLRLIIFKRIKGSIPHFACVALEVDYATATSSIDLECSGEGWIEQGYLEEVSADGYDDWKAGARVGIEFALKFARLTQARVVVRKITGLTTDTNPTIVGAAAAIATWNAIGYTPAQEVLERLEGSVFVSWSRGANAIPVFD